jgi:hypothetical protein
LNQFIMGMSEWIEEKEWQLFFLAYNEIEDRPRISCILLKLLTTRLKNNNS